MTRVVGKLICWSPLLSAPGQIIGVPVTWRTRSGRAGVRVTERAPTGLENAYSI